MSAVELISYSQFASAVLSAGLTIKLCISGLFRRYQIFFLYFVFRIPYFVASGKLDPKSTTYLYLFLFTEPIVMLFYLLIVMELYQLVLERYKGLYTIGRWAMYAAIVISVGISVLTLLPKIAPSTPEPSRRVFELIAVERGLDLSLVIFILLIVGFLGRYPVPLSRNVVVHTVIYAIFFLSETFLLLLRTLFGVDELHIFGHLFGPAQFNLILATISIGCTIAWTWLLNAKGEEIQVHTPQLRPESEARVLQQLEALNQTLLKVSRK
jgi:hypothetical protein